MTIALGVLCVTVTGLWVGSSPWPLKLMRKYQFEHWFFVSILVGLFIMPWLITVAAFPHAIEAYRDVPSEKLILSNLCSLSWGVANVLCGLCYVRIGVGLTMAILTGLGASLATTIPLVHKGSGLFKDAPDITSPTGLMVLCGVTVMIAGVVMAALAGFGRDRVLKKLQKTSGSFLGGLIMAIVSGVASAGLTLAFVYSQGPIVSRMCLWNAGTTARVSVSRAVKNHNDLTGDYMLSGDGTLALPGAEPVALAGLSAKAAADKIAAALGFPDQVEDDPVVRVDVQNIFAPFPAWAMGILGGALVNLLFPLYLMIKNRSFGVLASSPGELLLSIFMGLQSCFLFALLGTGMILLGALGASVGAGIQQTTQMIGGQGLAFLSGEWKGVSGRPRWQMYLAILLLIIASITMVVSNQLTRTL
jgi:hypothetical protein